MYSKKIHYKKRDKLAQKFKEENGAVEFDFKTRTLFFPEGGIMAMEEYPVMLHRVKGYKKLPDGTVEVLFTKKKYPDKTIKASLWFEEVREHINYFKRLENFLKKVGYDTEVSEKWKKKLAKELKYVKDEKCLTNIKKQI